MNARTEGKHLSISDNVVDGDLLHVGFQYGDSLQLNLYGEPASEERGFRVTHVSVIDSFEDISILFTEYQLECMGEWLDFKDRTDSIGKSVGDQMMRAVRRGRLN